MTEPSKPLPSTARAESLFKELTAEVTELLAADRRFRLCHSTIREAFMLFKQARGDEDGGDMAGDAPSKPLPAVTRQPVFILEERASDDEIGPWTEWSPKTGEVVSPNAHGLTNGGNPHRELVDWDDDDNMAFVWVQSRSVPYVPESRLAQSEAELAAVRAALCRLTDVEIDTGETTLEVVGLVERDIKHMGSRADEAEKKLADARHGHYGTMRELERERALREGLVQVAIEAIRVIHCTTHGGDPRVFEPCEMCSLGGVGNLRDALTKALGPGYTGLVWGNDMNVDAKKLDAALSRGEP